MKQMLQQVLEAYGLENDRYKVHEFGSGLINNTWRVHAEDGQPGFILQRINHAVFTRPEDIADNIQRIGAWLKKHHPDYFFIAPLATRSGETLYKHPAEGYFRVFPFLQNSVSIDTVQTPAQAYEAARQFGLFTRLLSGMDAQQLKITLPDFHNLPLRYTRFEQSLVHGNAARMEEAKPLISYLQQQQHIVQQFERIRQSDQFRIRVTHHDTKISNVLFNQSDAGLCVIDLDTVMPGYFFSDVGDMMRTYLSPVSEEEQDFNRISVRDDFFGAIVKGYLSEMGPELTSPEKDHFVYAGKCMIYMQALRFLTDYLENDRYYTPRYEKHNLLRAGNQVILLQRLLEKEERLTRCVQEALSTTS